MQTSPTKIRDDAHIDFRNMALPYPPPPPVSRSPAFCLFPDFRQDRQFFTLISFFPVPLEITLENRTRLKKLFI